MGQKHSDKKSRDFSFRNPGIFADSKSRDPARAWSLAFSFWVSVEGQIDHGSQKRFFIGPRCPWGPIYGSGSLKLTHSLSYLCADLTDVTLADEDTNSILTDNANKAIQGNVAMQVTQPSWKIYNYCK